MDSSSALIIQRSGQCLDYSFPWGIKSLPARGRVDDVEDEEATLLKPPNKQLGSKSVVVRVRMC